MHNFSRAYFRHGDMGAFLGAHFFKNGIFCLHPDVIFNHFWWKYIFFKTQGTRLCVIVAPNKGLEYHLLFLLLLHFLTPNYQSDPIWFD